jgi:HK97 family phage major capsid protein
MVRGENRATTFQSENTDNLGGYLVNPRYAANVLDLARAKTRVLQAGASLIPMETLEEKVAKLVTDPTPAWRNERDAISGSGIEFGEVALKAKSLACLAKVPFELVEDAANFGRVLRHALAQAFAVSLDAASLTGSGTDPEPLGLLNAGIAEIASTDTGSPTTWDDFISGVRTVREANYSPSGIILPEADEAALASLTGSDGHYVSAPAYVADVPRLTSGNMPAVATGGEGAVFGGWQHLFIGMRTSFEIKVLNERFADTGEIGFIGWLRADVQVAQDAAFAMIRRA